jgi:hypothetical protein
LLFCNRGDPGNNDCNEPDPVCNSTCLCLHGMLSHVKSDRPQLDDAVWESLLGQATVAQVSDLPPAGRQALLSRTTQDSSASFQELGTLLPSTNGSIQWIRSSLGRVSCAPWQ